MGRERKRRVKEEYYRLGTGDIKGLERRKGREEGKKMMGLKWTGTGKELKKGKGRERKRKRVKGSTISF